MKKLVFAFLLLSTLFSCTKVETEEFYSDTVSVSIVLRKSSYIYDFGLRVIYTIDDENNEYTFGSKDASLKFIDDKLYEVYNFTVDRGSVIRLKFNSCAITPLLNIDCYAKYNLYHGYVEYNSGGFINIGGTDLVYPGRLLSLTDSSFNLLTDIPGYPIKSITFYPVAP